MMMSWSIKGVPRMTHTTTSVMVWMGRKAAKALTNLLGSFFTGARSVSAAGVPLSFPFPFLG